jgi:hypothetical protein
MALTLEAALGPNRDDSHDLHIVLVRMVIEDDKAYGVDSPIGVPVVQLTDRMSLADRLLDRLAVEPALR